MDIVLVGGGAMALETEQYILACNIAGRGVFRSDGCETGVAHIKGLIYEGDGRLDDFQTRPPHIGTPDAHSPIDAHYIITIGDPGVRRSIWMNLSAKGAKFATIIHPSCAIAANASIGAGTILCPFVFAGSLSTIGGNVILNTYASVGHDARVASHCVLSPYSCLNGGAVLGEASFMGSGALVTPQKTVGRGSKLAAGAIVFADVPPGSLMVGNPAAGRQMFAVPPKTETDSSLGRDP